MRLSILSTALPLSILAACAAGAEPEGSDKSLVSLQADTSIAFGINGGRLSVTRLAGGWIPSSPSPVPLIDTVFVKGEPKPVQWAHRAAAEEIVEGKPVRFPFTCSDPALELVSEWTARPGPGPVEHTIRIANKSGDEILLPLQNSLDLVLRAPADHSLEAFWVEKGSGTPSKAGVHREPIADGYRFEGHSTGYSNDGKDRDMIPWLCVRDATANRGFYVGVEFSGNIRVALTAAKKDADLELHVEAGINPAGGEYRTRVPAGGSFETPPAFVGCFEGDVDDAANRLHRFVETHLRPAPPDDRYPYLVNNSWGSGMQVDEGLARKMIDESAELGLDIYHIDAGWFQTVGDWHPHREKFAKGLAPVADYARSKGLRFGIWTGWTQGGNAPRGGETLAVDDPAQRDWFTKDYPANWKPHDFTGADVCLGGDGARDWCLRDIRRMVKEYKLDLLEHDQRMIVNGCTRTTHRHTSHPGDVSYHATLGYYGVYDRLRKEFPKLILEDCVNGGRMVDFGVAKRVNYICYTDTYDPLSNRRGFYDSSYPLPPSMLEAYIANDPGPSLATFKAMLRSGMMGWCTIMCDTGAWNAEQHAAAKRQFAMYKTALRPLINRANLYHIEPRPDGHRWDGVEYFDPAAKRGVVYAFRGTPKGKTPDAEHAFKLRGLQPEAKYAVRFEDKTSPDAEMTGAQLMSEGVTVRIAEQGGSELVYVREK